MQVRSHLSRGLGVALVWPMPAISPPPARRWSSTTPIRMRPRRRRRPLPPKEGRLRSKRCLSAMQPPRNVASIVLLLHLVGSILSSQMRVSCGIRFSGTCRTRSSTPSSQPISEALLLSRARRCVRCGRRVKAAALSWFHRSRGNVAILARPIMPPLKPVSRHWRAPGRWNARAPRSLSTLSFPSLLREWSPRFLVWKRMLRRLNGASPFPRRCKQQAWARSMMSRRSPCF